MKTSATITNRTVSSSSLAESPKRGACSACSAGAASSFITSLTVSTGVETREKLRASPKHPQPADDARHRMIVDRDRQAEQCVPNDEPGMIIRHVGELAVAGDVADRIDAAVAGP